METNNLEKLRILYVGAEAEFNSPLLFENYMVEFNSANNPFSASQWITANGLPDGIICEKKLPGGNGFGFFDLWIEQFDAGKKIPFVSENTNMSSALKILSKKKIESIDGLKLHLRPENIKPEIYYKITELFEKK